MTLIYFFAFTYHTYSVDSSKTLPKMTMWTKPFVLIPRLKWEHHFCQCNQNYTKLLHLSYQKSPSSIDLINVRNAFKEIVWHKKKKVSGSYVVEKNEAFLCICCSSNSTSWIRLLISFEFIVIIRSNSFVVQPSHTPANNFPHSTSVEGMEYIKSGIAYNQLSMH